MIVRLILSICLVLCVARVVAASMPPAPDLPAEITLEQSLELLDKHSPRALAEQATVQVVAADRIAAQTLPNPTLNYGGLQLTGGTNTGAAAQHQFVVEQPLLLFGQRKVRSQLADLRVAAEQARVTSSLADLRLKVRQAFATLLARQDELKILEESLNDLQRVEGVVRGRATAGDRSRYDVARIEVQTHALRVEVANKRTDAQDASGQLAALLGLPDWAPRAIGSLRRATPSDVTTLWQTARSAASLVAVRERQAAAYGGITAAKREAWPIPSLAAGALVTRDDDAVSAVSRLSLPLPLLDRNQGEIARATAEADAETLALTGGARRGARRGRARGDGAARAPRDPGDARGRRAAARPELRRMAKTPTAKAAAESSSCSTH